MTILSLLVELFLWKTKIDEASFKGKKLLVIEKSAESIVVVLRHVLVPFLDKLDVDDYDVISLPRRLMAKKGQ
eukprot:scaffold3136_cov102-Cylindrotheca_fusiformis.AAC.3